MLPTGPAALRFARLLALLLPAALLGGAYLSQYGFGLYPCEMCWWQRYPHFAALGLAVIGFAVPSARWPVVLATLAIAGSGLIGGYHAGVEYHWWEGITHCTSTVTPGADVLKAILNAPLVRCDQAQWTLFGVSLAGFNFLFSTGGALVLATLLARSART